MTHKLDADDFFIHRVQELCAARQLRFFLIEPLWAESFLEYFSKGEVFAKVLLNMHSEHHQPEEIYHRLVRMAHRKGTQVIDSPDIALEAFNKARVYPKLDAAGIKMPFTLTVTRDTFEGLVLTPEQFEKLGSPFVIKPSMGYGRRGVILDATSVADVKRSATVWPDETYLLQQRVVPKRTGEEPAYFRVYYVFGMTWICWWNCFNDRYRQTTVEEESALALGPLREIVTRIAGITGMRFFSSEIAQTEAGEFVVIDYVNDQCHLLTQSASPQNGVPDALVSAIAERLVGGAQELMRSG